MKRKLSLQRFEASTDASQKLSQLFANESVAAAAAATPDSRPRRFNNSSQLGLTIMWQIICLGRAELHVRSAQPFFQRPKAKAAASATHRHKTKDHLLRGLWVANDVAAVVVKGNVRSLLLV